MPSQPSILFCENPIEPREVDADFEEEYSCAKQNGLATLLFNFEGLTNDNNGNAATKKIKPIAETTVVIYRGWMLTPHLYSLLYNDLLAKNYKLINSPTEYQNCHYLPDSLRFISGLTPKTIFEKLTNPKSIDTLIEKARVFGNKPVIIKDFVKSEKHDWATACFVSNASETQKLMQTIDHFIDLRGKYLNEGMVIREFVDLKPLTTHSKSGMPLTEEYRLFFYCQKLIGIYNYWEEGEYQVSRPDTNAFEEIARSIESNFFSMDIARKMDDEFIIIELGDGQVAGLPDGLDINTFYKTLKDLQCRIW